MIDKTYKNFGVKVSYLIGLPIGLLVIFLVFGLPLLIEPMTAVVIVGQYGFGIIGLTIAFIISLRIAGSTIVQDLLSGKSILKTSYLYCLTVNIIIWSTFIIMTLIQNINNIQLTVFLFPIVICPLSIGLSTYTIGLLICFIVSRKLKK